MRIAICNAREGNGLSAGSGRNRMPLPKNEEYLVYTSQPASYTVTKIDLWRVYDKGAGKTFNVTRKQDTEVLACQCPAYWTRFKDLGGEWADFGVLGCTCQHTLAVRMYEDATRKNKKKENDIEHAAKWIFREHGHKLNSPDGAKELWRDVRIYANRKRLQLAALTQAIMKVANTSEPSETGLSLEESPPSPERKETWREGDNWSKEVREMLTTNPQFRKEHNAAHRRSLAATPCVRRAASTMERKKSKCVDCNAPIEKGIRCSKCVGEMLGKWDGNTVNLPTTNANIHVPTAPEGKKPPKKETKFWSQNNGTPNGINTIEGLHSVAAKTKTFHISQNCGNIILSTQTRETEIHQVTSLS